MRSSRLRSIVSVKNDRSRRRANNIRKTQFAALRCYASPVERRLSINFLGCALKLCQHFRDFPRYWRAQICITWA